MFNQHKRQPFYEDFVTGTEGNCAIKETTIQDSIPNSFIKRTSESRNKQRNSNRSKLFLKTRSKKIYLHNDSQSHDGDQSVVREVKDGLNPSLTNKTKIPQADNSSNDVMNNMLSFSPEEQQQETKAQSLFNNSNCKHHDKVVLHNFYECIKSLLIQLIQQQATNIEDTYMRNRIEETINGVLSNQLIDFNSLITFIQQK